MIWPRRRATARFDVRQKVSGNWILELPFGPNRAFLRQGRRVVEDSGWVFGLAGRIRSQSGSFTLRTMRARCRRLRRGAELAAAGPASRQSIKGAGTAEDWFNTAAFSAPAAGTYGTASRNSIELPGMVSVNWSLSRTVPMGETRSFEARVTANNVLNTVQYSGVSTTINSPTLGR